MVLRIEELRAFEPFVTTIGGFLADTFQQILVLRFQDGRKGVSNFYILFQIFQRFDAADKGADGQG